MIFFVRRYAMKNGCRLVVGFIVPAILLALSSCSRPVPKQMTSTGALLQVSSAQVLLRDDGDRESLKQAVSASIGYWQGQDPKRQIYACGEMYQARDFTDSLRRFLEIVNSAADDELENIAAQEFALCQAASDQQPADVLVTGYYQPRFKASRERVPPFIYPVYRVPADLISAQIFTAKGVEKSVGRLHAGRLEPYWSRAEIETQARLAGNELCYLADPVEVFILHVQGSGLVEYADGSVRQLLFAGTNGLPYRSIGRLLADEGRIPLAEIDMPRIRRFLDEHRDERQRILYYNERYVFFRLTDIGPGLGPVGSMGAVLTPGRSVALDDEWYPRGGLYFLQTERPVMQDGDPVPSWQPMTRFVLNQDSGAAIKGAGRLDFFWGSGDYPERAAGLMKRPGRLYLLVKKNRTGPVEGNTGG